MTEEEIRERMKPEIEKLDFDTKKGGKGREELIENGLIKKVEVNTGTRGRNPKLFELTKDGRQYLESIGEKVRRTAKGGAEHRWWQRKVQKYYEEKGYDSFIEYHIGKKSIGVYSIKDDEKIATEIALSPKHEVENVEKCLDEGMDQIQILYSSKDVKRKIEKEIEDKMGNIPDKILFSHVSNLS